MDIKRIILDRVIETVREQTRNAEEGRQRAVQESVFHKGAMASRYDTFKEEAQYLAAGYSTQLQELNRILGTLESLRTDPPTIKWGSLYAIVELEDCEDLSISVYFLLPAGGGEIHEVNGEKITVLTIGSPAASALIRGVPGTTVEMPDEGAAKKFTILSVI